MPLDKSGSYHMNPQAARMHDMAGDMGTGTAEQPLATVTLTKNADGTITCDDGTGQPSVHDNMQEALDYAGMKLGGDEEAGEMGGAEPSDSDIEGGEL